MSIRCGFQNLQISVSPLIPHPFPQQIIADRNNDPLNPGGKSSRITVKTGAFFPCPNECRLNGIIRIGMRIDDLKRNFPEESQMIPDQLRKQLPDFIFPLHAAQNS